jgi:hypothetical protein
MVQRKNEKGEPFQRIFVHIKNWSETADARKAKDRLLSGNELKIVYDDPWFWKVSLNTWTPKPAPVAPSLCDRKPRIRIEFDEDAKNVDAAAALLGSLDIGKEDRRPYSERRSDPAYCEQEGRTRPSRFTDRSPVRDDRRRSPVRDDRRPRDDRRDDRRPARDDRRRDTKKENKVAPAAKPVEVKVQVAKPVEVKVQVQATKPVEAKVQAPLVRDKELVARMEHAYRCEITDEIYLANRQAVREQLKENYEDADLINYKNNNGANPVMPKRKQRTVIVEEVLVKG